MNSGLAQMICNELSNNAAKGAQLLVELALAIDAGMEAFPGRRMQMHFENILAHAAMTYAADNLSGLKADDQAWFMVSSSIGLRNIFLRQTDPRTIEEYAQIAKDALALQIEGNAITSDAASAELTAAMEDMRGRYPQLGLSYGYVGNCSLGCGPAYDDRSFKIFTKLATPKCVNASDVSWGGSDLANLGHLAIRARTELADWCQLQQDRLDRGEIRSLVAAAA